MSNNHPIKQNLQLCINRGEFFKLTRYASRSAANSYLLLKKNHNPINKPPKEVFKQIANVDFARYDSTNCLHINQPLCSDSPLQMSYTSADWL